MTSYFPSLAFVASPDPAAAVLLDLNGDVAGASVRALHEGFSLGMASLGGDAGDRARAWGIREGVTVPLWIEGPRAAAKAALRLLAQQVTRDGWLRTQLDATSPVVWFRVYASAPEALDWDLIFNDRAEDRWRVSLPLSVESFGVGETVSIAVGSVTNNPLDATFDATLPTIAGEMPAPAAVKVASTSWMLAPGVAISKTAPAVLAATMGPNVTGTADAAYVGGTRYETSVAFAQWSHVASFVRSAGDPGGFRALFRVGGSANTGAFKLRWRSFGPGAVAAAVYSDPVTVPVVAMRRWVDTGRLPFPVADGTGLGATSTTTYQLQALRVVAGGELRFDDRLIMASADAPATLVRTQAPDMGTGAATALLDAEQRTAVQAVAAGAARQSDFAGSWPMLRPGDANHLMLLQNLDPTLMTGREDNKGAAAVVTVSYRPRYLWGI